MCYMLPLWSAFPAMLAFILVFLDDGITWHLINRAENKLTHGAAYNYDTIIIGAMIVVNSCLGLPWLVAATVRSVNHVQAMAEKDASGKIISVHQTRLTHLFIHLLVLITIFAMNAIKEIPMAVLYGVFLYMGLVSLWTNQFYERVLMFFMQPKLCPKRPFTSCVARCSMHKFTLLQLALFASLYVVKTIKMIAIACPIVIALCIPVRLCVLPKISSKSRIFSSWMERTTRSTRRCAPVRNKRSSTVRRMAARGVRERRVMCSKARRARCREPSALRAGARSGD